jgi:hypothetical protein
MNVELAAMHLRAQVHAGRAVEGEPAACHAGTDEFDPAAIALDPNVLIAGVAVDGEELSQGNLRVAILERQGSDFRHRLASEKIGPQAFSLDRDRCFSEVLEL